MIRIILACFFLSMSFSCDSSGDTSNSSNNTGVTIDDDRKEIERMQDSLLTVGSVLEVQKYSRLLLEKTLRFVETYPRDRKNPDYLLLAARSAIGIGEYEKGISILDSILVRYTNYGKLPEIMFLKAFTYDESLNKKEKAKEAYLKLIQTYPHDPLAKEAQLMLDNLFLSNEELIRKFEQQNP
jgi:tetratricopeptide (TPR) repeat protein